ncbi:MAG: glycosyltransferase [Actinomycetota bacterium]|nr:glycosyltransferase [Actinomycetota bacterium]
MTALSETAVLLLAVASMLACAAAVLATVLAKASRTRRMRVQRQLEHEISRLEPGDAFAAPKSQTREVLAAYVDVRQSATLSPLTVEGVRAWLVDQGVERVLIRKLGSRRAIRRVEAATALGYLPGDSVRQALVDALGREQRDTVRLRIAVALHQVDPDASVAILLDSILSASEWIAVRAKGLLLEAGRSFYLIARTMLATTETRLTGILIDFAAVYPATDLRDFLVARVWSKDADVSIHAAQALRAMYPSIIADERYMDHPLWQVRANAYGALASTPSRRTLERLLARTSDMAQASSWARATPDYDLEFAELQVAAANLLRTQPSLLPTVAEAFVSTDVPEYRSALASLLSSRIQYYFMQLIGPDADAARAIVRAIVASGRSSELIGFLNRNRNVELENEVLACIQPLLEASPQLVQELEWYLAPRILDKIGLEERSRATPPRVEQRVKSKIVRMYALLVVALLAFPLAFWLLNRSEFGVLSPLDLLREYVTAWNSALLVYIAALQVATLAILVFAVIGVRAQARSWRAKPYSLLFRPKVLPSVSIVAPAFNEESTIVESASSLLGIQYPDFELIIVNDGSRDATMERLIEHFELEKVDRTIPTTLATKAVRGIYASPAVPQLLVVDKDNGGKADSLNAGINMSTKEYFCGIDADSLLESDSMLKVAAGCLDSVDEMVAAGGNVFPINGCTVERGALVKVGLARSPLARFQTIEYIRAFMAGRVGWAYVKSLLIISGAFGLFRKERVIQAGGYLTESGPYRQDTVGEDMELVVRLRREMIESGIPHQINYAYNANCWTEVPETISTLHRQRDRWQRGLVDIQFLHRRLLLNPRYKSTGLIGMPYYFVFELFGPLIEAQGYIMLILAAITGLLEPAMAIALFTTIVLWGILVSTLSLYIAELQTSYFTRREIATMLWYAVLENFGFRQLASLWRVSGFFSSLRRPRGWGEMRRKGFAVAAQ